MVVSNTDTLPVRLKVRLDATQLTIGRRRRRRRRERRHGRIVSEKNNKVSYSDALIYIS